MNALAPERVVIISDFSRVRGGASKLALLQAELLSAKGIPVTYFAGDTAVFSDMALIGAMGLDVAILPIGNNFTMGPDDALLALGYLHPKTVIPCHYSTWPIIEADAEAWAERVKAETAVNPIVPAIDEAISL